MSMNVWTVQVTVTTTRRLDPSTATSLMSGIPACRGVLCSHGVPGASVLLGVEATTAAGAYGAALVILVAEVLPRLEEPVLTDVLISTGAQPLAEAEHPVTGMSAIGRGETARA